MRSGWLAILAVLNDARVMRAAYPTGDRRCLSRRKIAMAELLLRGIAAATTEAESWWTDKSSPLRLGRTKWNPTPEAVSLGYTSALRSRSECFALSHARRALPNPRQNKGIESFVSQPGRKVGVAESRNESVQPIHFASPLNPPILGDFRERFFPRMGGQESKIIPLFSNAESSVASGC